MMGWARLGCLLLVSMLVYFQLLFGDKRSDCCLGTFYSGLRGSGSEAFHLLRYEAKLFRLVVFACRCWKLGAS